MTWSVSNKTLVVEHFYSSVIALKSHLLNGVDYRPQNAPFQISPSDCGVFVWQVATARIENSFLQAKNMLDPFLVKMLKHSCKLVYSTKGPFIIYASAWHRRELNY